MILINVVVFVVGECCEIAERIEELYEQCKR